MKKLHLSALAFFALLLPFACQKESTQPQNADNSVLTANDRSAIIIPAGSVNALADALQNSGTIILEAGIHTETNPIVISGYHWIIGRPGAVLRVGTTPFTDYDVPISAALHFKNASGSAIQGVQIETTNPIGGTAILIENSSKTTVQRCEITGFQYGILVEKGPLASISQNKLSMSTAWQTGDIPEAHGIIVINGDGANVEKNEVSGALFGIWACDKNGKCRQNDLHDNYIGLILCKVPADALRLPDGTTTGAQYSCQNWLVRSNTSNNNFNAGYLIIDGANYNTVDKNNADNNGSYDYELVGDSYRFGFLTPFSHHNSVKVANGDTVKDCGQNNIVSGGIVIDTNIEPCD